MSYTFNIESTEEIPEFLYKVISPEDWEKSMQQKCLVLSTMDIEFIHLAKDTQLKQVIEKFWRDKTFVVLKINSKKLSGDLKYETNPGGTNKYYHLYDGSIPLDSIVEVMQRK